MYTKEELRQIDQLQVSPVYAVRFDRRNWRFELQNESTLKAHDRREFPICYIGAVHSRKMVMGFEMVEQRRENGDTVMIEYPTRIATMKAINGADIGYTVPDISNPDLQWNSVPLTKKEFDAHIESCHLPLLEDAEQYVKDMNSILASWLEVDFDGCETMSEYALVNFLLWLFGENCGLFIFPIANPLDEMEGEAGYIKTPEATIKRIGGSPAYRSRNQKANKHSQLNEVIKRDDLAHKAHIKKLAGNSVGALITQAQLEARKETHIAAAIPAGRIIPTVSVPDVNSDGSNKRRVNETINVWNEEDLILAIDVDNYGNDYLQGFVTDTVNHRVTK